MSIVGFLSWFILGVILVIVTWGAVLAWRNSNIPPAGYTFGIQDKGDRFERVVIYDRGGRKVADNYTSIYGLKGAHRECIREAKKALINASRSNKEYEKAAKRFEHRS